MKSYTTWGSVRGDCGHMHQTVEAAERCIAKDNRDCNTQGGYSDRGVRVIEERKELASYDVTRGPGKPLLD